MEQPEKNKSESTKDAPHKKGPGIFGKIILDIFLLIVLYFIFYLLIARPHKMSGDTMSPYLKNGQTVWSEKVSYYLHPPRRDDVVFVADPANSSEMVTRIIGLPGETVSLRPGQVKINGETLNYPHVNWGTLPAEASSWPSGEITLKDNQYFGMTDNQGFTVTNTGNVSADKSVLQAAFQQALESSTFMRNQITGKASNIIY